MTEQQNANEVTRRCEHWIGPDTTGRACKADVTTKYRYCEKHLPIQRARIEKQIARDRESARRTEDAWRARNVPRLPQMRVQLESAEAEYARRTASAVNDRAAVGGDMHRSIARAQRSVLSDTNVARVVELGKIIERLQHDIARAEKPAPS